MNEAAPSVRSFGELARVALESGDWPAESRPKERSLAALFSKLDRNIELEWLADRPAVQQALADALNCPASRIARKLDLGRDSSDLERRRFRFDDVRFAHAIDLSTEDLPPGLPEEVKRPAAWSRLWWRAASGVGRTLVGRWLESRGLARYVFARDFQTALELVPNEGRVFLELDANVTPTELTFAPHLQVCVATDCMAPRHVDPQTPVGDNPSTWLEVESPPIQSYLRALLRWLAPRLPDDGHFELESAYVWLSEAADAQLVDTFGSVLSLAGLIDEFGVPQLQGKSLTALAERLVQRRLSQAGQDGNADAQGLKRRGFELLRTCAERALTDSDIPWSRARSRDEWLRLLPDELQRGIDAEWLRISLNQSPNRAAARELEKTLAQLPPGGLRVIRALEGAALLRSAGPEDRLAAMPTWVRNIAAQQALQRLCRRSAFEWGEAMLRPHAAAGMTQAVLDTLLAEDTTVLDNLLELEDDDNPAYVAALECAFTCAGLAVLLGRELPHEQLEQLWQEQMDCSVQFSDDGAIATPGRRIRHAAPGAVGNERNQFDTGAAALGEGAWCLAALALAEQLENPHAGSAGLTPWTETEPSAASERVLNVIWHDVRALMPPIGAPLEGPGVSAQSQWCLEAFALGRRLGSLENSHTTHPLLLPGKLMNQALGGQELAFSDCTQLLSDPVLVTALRYLCDTDAQWPAVAMAIWDAWAKQGADPSVAVDDTTLRSSDAESAWIMMSQTAAAWFWPHLPEKALRICLARADVALPYAQFSSKHWEAFVSERLSSRHFEDLLAWEAMPLEAFLKALDQANFTDQPHLARTCWRRFPEAVLQHAQRLLEQEEHERAFRLLELSPPIQTANLVSLCESLTRHRGASGELLLRARRWLHERVAARASGWRSAYPLLAQLERRAQRVARLRD